MYQKIVEILIYVLNELQRTNKNPAEIDVSVLEKKGYSTSEISTAFSWLYDKIQANNLLPDEQQQKHSFRILHNVEKGVITSEAYGYLLLLHELNLLTNAEMELIIDRAMMSGFAELGTDEIKSIVLSVMFDNSVNLGGGKILPNIQSVIH